MIQNTDIVVVTGDKHSSIVMVTKSDITKLDTMTNDSIMKGTYMETTDILKELLQFQDFLYRNFNNYECYKDL